MGPITLNEKQENAQFRVTLIFTGSVVSKSNEVTVITSRNT